MVMEPEAPEMVTPEPWVSVARVKPEPLPMKRVPLGAVEVSRPVPPREVESWFSPVTVEVPVQ